MKRLLYCIALTLCLMCYMLSYADAISESISDNLLRFHIISNSNSDYDTNIKLSLRNYLSEQLANTHYSPYSDEYLSQLEQSANEWLEKNGISYRANAAYKRCFIPRKTYMDITLPQGFYNTLRLTLGEGSGENWWCVAYPSLCFKEAKLGKLSESGKELLKEKLPKESYKIITDQNKYRLFIVDFICGITQKPN